MEVLFLCLLKPSFIKSKLRLREYLFYDILILNRMLMLENNMTSLIRKIKDIKLLFLLFLSVIIIINVVQLADSIKEKREKINKPNILRFPGLLFSGLQGIFKDTVYVGYYTDRDQSIKINAAKFAQAQYILAPAILDFNNTNHEYILFDCTSERIANAKIKEIGAIAIKKNQFGIILARKTK